MAIHWTNERCQKYLGMPGAYEAGFERLNWFTQLIMSTGWETTVKLRQARSAQFRALSLGKEMRCRLFAKVTGKRVEEGTSIWSISRSGRCSHPRGEETHHGRRPSIVELPSNSNPSSGGSTA